MTRNSSGSPSELRFRHCRQRAQSSAAALEKTWPVKGLAYRRACEACHDALAGAGNEEAVRPAFGAAAVDAGVINLPACAYSSAP